MIDRSLPARCASRSDSLRISKQKLLFQARVFFFARGDEYFFNLAFGHLLSSSIEIVQNGRTESVRSR